MVTSKSKAQIYFFIIEVDHMLCHAVPLGMILPITAPPRSDINFSTH